MLVVVFGLLVLLMCVLEMMGSCGFFVVVVGGLFVEGVGLVGLNFLGLGLCYVCVICVG